MSFLENLLLSHQWEKKQPIPYNETIARKSDFCYIYKNPLHTEIGLLYDSANAVILLRLSSPAHLHFYYLQIHVSGNSPVILRSITNMQDQILSENYISFYFHMQSLCNISVLPWEEWETAEAIKNLKLLPQ